MLAEKNPVALGLLTTQQTFPMFRVHFMADKVLAFWPCQEDQGSTSWVIGHSADFPKV